MHDLVICLFINYLFLSEVFTCDDKWMRYTHINEGKHFSPFNMISYKLGVTPVRCTTGQPGGPTRQSSNGRNPTSW